jgi:hypothetical protein
MMSLALAVSCTPGSCTTTRSRPCCWITGSATPSSLTRLCSVVMFCLSACSCTEGGLGLERVARSLKSLPSADGPPFAGRELVGQQVARAVQRGRRRGSALRPVAVAADAAVADVLVAQHRAHVAGSRPRPSWSAPPSCPPASGSARRRAGPGPGTSARARKRPARPASATAGSARRCSSGRPGRVQRLSDMASLALSCNPHLDRGTVQRSGRHDTGSLELPPPSPLSDHLLTAPAGDSPKKLGMPPPQCDDSPPSSPLVI